MMFCKVRLRNYTAISVLTSYDIFLWKPQCWSLSVKNKISAQPISVSFRNVRKDLELLMSSPSTRPFMWKSSNTNANSVEKSLGLKDVSSHTSSITLVRIRFLFVINPLILLSSCYSTSTVFPCKLVLRIWWQIEITNFI